MKQSVIIFDLDGTIADTSWRRHLVEGMKQDWKAFFDAMGDDPVREPVAELYRVLWECRRFEMWIVSGRPDTYRRLTELWLTLNQLPYDHLFLRKVGDQRPDELIKEEILREIQSDGKHVLFTVDDRNSVVAMWRRNSITCLQAAEGPF